MECNCSTHLQGFCFVNLATHPWGCVANFTKPKLRLLTASRERTDVAEQPRTIGEHIKKARIQKGLHQSDVAKLIGVSSNQLCAWEIGKRRIMKVKYFPRILKFLGYIPELKKPYSIGRDMTIVKQIYGWNNKSLAEELGLDPSTVSNWIKGKQTKCKRKNEQVVLSLKKLLEESEK